MRVYDDYDIWDAAPGHTLHVTFAPISSGEELEGPRHVSKTLNFNTNKLLMAKVGSDYNLALSEVEFSRECEVEGMY